MAELSDQLLVVTMLAYLAAMLCYAAEYAFGARGRGRPAAARPPRQRELVGAGGRPGRRPSRRRSDRPARTPAGARPAGPRWLGRVAVVLTVARRRWRTLGVLVTRGLAAERVPWGNMYEFVLAVTCVGAVGLAGAAASGGPALRHLGPVRHAGAGAAARRRRHGAVHRRSAPLVPALNSYWFVIHVSAAALASGILLLGFVPAVLFLVRAGYDRGQAPLPVHARAPGCRRPTRWSG